MAQSTAAASPTGARRAAVGEPLTPNLLAHNLVHVKDDVIREKYVCLLILIVSIRFCKPPALLYIYFTDDARLRCWGKLHLCSSPQTQRIKEPTNRITTPYKKGFCIRILPFLSRIEYIKTPSTQNFGNFVNSIFWNIWEKMVRWRLGRQFFNQKNVFINAI